MIVPQTSDCVLQFIWKIPICRITFLTSNHLKCVTWDTLDQLLTPQAISRSSSLAISTLSSLSQRYLVQDCTWSTVIGTRWADRICCDKTLWVSNKHPHSPQAKNAEPSPLKRIVRHQPCQEQRSPASKWLGSTQSGACAPKCLDPHPPEEETTGLLGRLLPDLAIRRRLLAMHTNMGCQTGGISGPNAETKGPFSV